MAGRREASEGKDAAFAVLVSDPNGGLGGNGSGGSHRRPRKGNNQRIRARNAAAPIAPSAAAVVVALHHPLVGRQTLEAHGPASMDAFGGHGHFGTKAKLAAVGKARARIGINRR